MGGIATLGAGLLSLAFVLGFVVAASGTPVGAVTVPAVFGLVAAAFALVPSPWLSKAPSEPPQADGKSQVGDKAARLLARAQDSTQRHAGVILLCFSVGFMGGIAVGARARIGEWFRAEPAPFVTTWQRQKLPSPPNADAAIYWIYLQGVLQARGLDDEQIKAMYELQSKDWTVRAPIGTGHASAPKSPSPVASVPSSQNQHESGLDEWLRQPQPKNPIANEPVKKKAEELIG